MLFDTVNTTQISQSSVLRTFIIVLQQHFTQRILTISHYLIKEGKDG